MIAIKPESFNETYHFDRLEFQDQESPDKTIQIDQEIELTIKRESETGKLLLSAINLNDLDFIQIVLHPLYAQNRFLNIGTETKYLNIIGTDTITHKIIKINAKSFGFNIDEINSVKVTDEEKTSITEHRDHYLYKNSQLSDVLWSSSIEIKGIDYPFTICNESLNNTPHNLDCISLVYSIHDGRFPPEEIQDYHLHIISFLFGCPLTNFGYSRYDDSGNVIETYVISPRYQTIRMSLNSPYPPIQYNDLSASQIQEIFNPIIVNYRNLDLNIFHDYIKALLRRFWESHLLYLDYKFHLIVSGLDVFMRFWSQQNNVNLNPKEIISKDVYDSELLPYIKIIKKKIGKCNNISKDERDNIYRNIGELNKDRKTTKLEKMYESVGLPLTPNEVKIIRLRGEMMHEKPFICDGEVDAYVDYYHDAVTLCNRSFLKLLDYTGDYIDYRQKWKR